MIYPWPWPSSNLSFGQTAHWALKSTQYHVVLRSLSGPLNGLRISSFILKMVPRFSSTRGSEGRVSHILQHCLHTLHKRWMICHHKRLSHFRLIAMRPCVPTVSGRQIIFTLKLKVPFGSISK